MSYGTPGIRNVLLSGELGKKFGRRHRFAVNSPAEAVRALCANFPEFKRELLTSGERGVGYRVLVDKQDVGADALTFPSGSADIRIIPVVRGAAKSGIWSILAGIVIIVASVISFNYEFIGEGVMEMGVGLGLSLSFGGVARLLAPHAKTPGKSAASYNFGGPVNTADAGLPVPFGYGEMIVGSAVISAGIVSDQVPTNETGPANLAAVVTQSVDNQGVATYTLYASWEPAGQAIGYDVTVQGAGYGPTTQPRTNGTSVLVSVPGAGPFSVVCNPVESDSTYGPGSSCVSSYVPAS